jgi:hypothetical protein
LVSIASDVRYLISIKHRGSSTTCELVINITVVVILRLFSA